VHTFPCTHRPRGTRSSNGRSPALLYCCAVCEHTGSTLEDVLDARAASLIGDRHKGRTSGQYDRTCRRFALWIEKHNIRCSWLTQPVGKSLQERQLFAEKLDLLFMRWCVYLVEVQGTVQTHSAVQYVTHVRSRVDDAVRFDTLEMSPIDSLGKLVLGLQREHGTKKRRRDPLLQQHLLQWETKLDSTDHQHRLAMAIAVTTVMCVSRVSDFCPPTSAFNPDWDASQADVKWEKDVGFLRLTDHKTRNRGEWPPKIMPKPDVTFPLRVGRASIRSWAELLSFTGHGLPHSVILSPYFQIRRLLLLQGESPLPPARRPLFEQATGKAASYSWFYTVCKRLAAACNHKYITPHSGRKGGIVAANATGKASTHDLQLLANMAQSSTTLIYDEATVTKSTAVVRAMQESTRTETMCDRAFGGSDFVGPRPSTSFSFHR